MGKKPICINLRAMIAGTTPAPTYPSLSLTLTHSLPLSPSCLSRVCTLRDETLSPAGAVHATNDNESRDRDRETEGERGRGGGCSAERDRAMACRKKDT